MDVLSHLEQEHRKVEELFAQLEASEPGQKRNQLVKELGDSLATHMAVEEQFIYPFVAQSIGREENKEARTEHELARDGLAKLQQLRDEPGFGAAVEMLKGGIAHHVEEEETELFPELRSKVPDELARLDPEQLEQQVKTGLSADAGAEPATDDATDQPTIDLTKDELYKQAQEADIPGRSSMTKAQLLEALSS